MKPLSIAATSVQPSTTLAISALANKMKEKGIDIVGFGTGEPDFETPDNIKQSAIRAIMEGKTRYTPAAGIPALRRAIAARLREDHGLEYSHKEIVVASGAKHSIFVALQTLLKAGDEVIIPAPYWLTYSESVSMAGGVPIIVYAPESQNFKVTPQQIEDVITDRTQAILINNPSNPTGMLYSAEELRAIADVCVKHDLYIISDEIYCSLVYDNKQFTSMGTLGEDVKCRTIIVNGLSKSYAMTGWRIGYTACPLEIATVMSNYLSHSTSAPSTISQYAALEALTGDQSGIIAMKNVFEERRNYFYERLNTIEGVSCIKPDGAFYIMMNIEKLIGKTIGGKLIKDGDDFAMAFLELGKVAVVPCRGFGAPNFVRWTYAASLEDIKEGLNRLESFLKM